MGDAFGEAVVGWNECFCDTVEVDCEGCAFNATGVRGFPIRLANDCELLEVWSSATNFVLWVLRVALAESGVRLRSTDVLRVEYGV